MVRGFQADVEGESHAKRERQTANSPAGRRQLPLAFVPQGRAGQSQVRPHGPWCRLQSNFEAETCFLF